MLPHWVKRREKTTFLEVGGRSHLLHRQDNCRSGIQVQVCHLLSSFQITVRYFRNSAVWHGAVRGGMGRRVDPTLEAVDTVLPTRPWPFLGVLTD